MDGIGHELVVRDALLLFVQLDHGGAEAGRVLKLAGAGEPQAAQILRMLEERLAVVGAALDEVVTVQP